MSEPIWWRFVESFIDQGLSSVAGSAISMPGASGRSDLSPSGCLSLRVYVVECPQSHGGTAKSSDQQIELAELASGRHEEQLVDVGLGERRDGRRDRVGVLGHAGGHARSPVTVVVAQIPL